MAPDIQRKCVELISRFLLLPFMSLHRRVHVYQKDSCLFGYVVSSCSLLYDETPGLDFGPISTLLSELVYHVRLAEQVLSKWKGC